MSVEKAMFDSFGNAAAFLKAVAMVWPDKVELNAASDETLDTNTKGN